MISGPTFQSFALAYRAVLAHIRDTPRYATSARTKSALETTNVSFTIRNPADRTPYLATRRSNIIFNHAEALWYLTGRDDLDMIAHYAPVLRNLSTDGHTLTGTAYGPRLFGATAPDGRSQFDRVIDLLREDPDSKRAAMIVMRPDELVDSGNPDVACTLGLQLMLRGGELHMTAYMRGNDAVIGLLGDTFAFTFIQELAALQLGVQIGTYTHHVGSMHINITDLPKVDAMLAERGGPTFPAAGMPPTTRTMLDQVADWEEQLRANSATFTPREGAGMALYWRQVVALFEVHRQLTHHREEPVTAEALAMLRPGHRWLVERRWPSRVRPGTAR